jgi:diguanylate cyclase (GGDEF)-like protein/PAS domain S-box-containing protein
MAVSPPLPTNEAERLAALHQYQILDTDAEAAFDGLTGLAAHICQAPIALITLVDAQRQWFKSKVGISLSETCREVSFCTYAILQSDLMLIPDTRQDPRFANNPLVRSEPHICFYAGAPLITPEGYAIGTLCVLDNVPRGLDPQQQEALETLAQQVIAQLELRRIVAALQQAAIDLLNISTALENAVEGISQLDAQGCYVMVNPAYAAMLGYEPREMAGMNWQGTVHPDDIPAVDAAYAQMLAQDKAEAEVRGIRRDGSCFFKQVVLVKARETEPDRPLHYCFMKDITARKQAETDLKLAYDALEQQVAERTAALSQANNLLKQEVTRRRRNEMAIHRQAQRERLMGEIAQRIRQSLDLEEILQTTVSEVRQFLRVDRVFIYRFEPDWSGVVAFESVEEPWLPTLGRNLIDPCFAERYVERYRQGYVHAVDDINTARLSECYIQFLTALQVKANLVVPILQGETLWGLLIAHQCREPRLWQQFEIDLLKQLSTQVAIAIQQANLYQQLTAANHELQRLAALDGLTQVANRRCFDEYLEREWRRALREQTPLALILCDIDFFKLYNDTYGHQAGDDCLRQVAQVLSSATERPADLVARYGGEEFVVVLPNTPSASAAYVADRLRETIAALHLPHSSSPINAHVTISLGVACKVPQPAETPSALIAAADQALYLAKAEGRNCCRVFQP